MLVQRDGSLPAALAAHLLVHGNDPGWIDSWEARCA
jgi:hypothetical protein